MHKTQGEARAYFSTLAPLIAGSTHCKIIIAPPFTALTAAVEAAHGTAISISGQNMCGETEGAFTGEVSAAMLIDAGCSAVIIGHSERRQFLGETDERVNKQIKAALAAGLMPILCVGETLAEREDGKTEEILNRQFCGGMAAVAGTDFSRIILAYEPVWAIGTGRTATPEIAAEAHRFLRQRAAEVFTAERAGALVGGASLNAEVFASIVNF